MIQPTTPSGKWKRAKNDALEDATGQRYCTSCRTLQPVEQVKFYRGMQRGTLVRCNTCQSKRLAAMERKAA